MTRGNKKDMSLMDNEILTARQRLLDCGYTCVLLQNGEEYCSRERGVKPLLSLLDKGRSFCGAVAADKTVGAGAAHLYVLLGVRAVWARVISAAALDILERNGIAAAYDERVEYIVNRKGDGMCPIEAAVLGAKDSNEAYGLIIGTLESLQGGN